ncbi:unnamed protein product [Gadus morhua 'NCC']
MEESHGVGWRPFRVEADVPGASGCYAQPPAGPRGRGVAAAAGGDVLFDQPVRSAPVSSPGGGNARANGGGG